MKSLRLVLVVLLVFLLPIRGAVAAGMLCEAGSGMGGAAAMSMQSGQPIEHPGNLGAAGQSHSSDDGSAATDVVSADTAADQATNGMLSADSCNLCIGGCSSTGLLSNPILALPDALNSGPFPSFAAAAPSFISDGLERPPRYI